MFNSARLKLTAWYVLILMSVSFLFSIAFYQVSTREIQQLIDRIEYDESRADAIIFKRPHLPPHILTLEELYGVKNRIGINLMIINIGILTVAGGASYFLAAKTLQPIQEMVDEQNQFISDASHELRTPIATLRAEIEGKLLEKRITDPQARAVLKSNLEEVNTLQELSNNLLLLAQSPGILKQHLHEKVSLREVLTKAQKKVAALAKEKKIKVAASIAEAQIAGNSSGLTEVFVILLDNAIKYSPPKSQIILSNTVTKVKTVITVSDTGSGIPAQDIPYIFNRFYRADKSRSLADGYGLGLAIAQKIITAHGGQIRVKSTSPSGSTFVVELPLSTS